MNIKELRLASINELIEAMYKTEDQVILNIIAMELTYRMYVPFSNTSFEELLLKNGYVPIEKKRGIEK
jgi:hypothetical protein